MKNIVTALFCALMVVLAVFFVFSPAPDRGTETTAEVSTEEGKETVKEWTCPMHPSVREPEPGQCPICEMDLVPAQTGSGFTAGEVTKAKVRTVPVERKFVTRHLSLFGKVEVDETRAASITAWVGGRIEKLYRDHHGKKIYSGQNMLELYSPELRATHRDLIQVRNNLESADEDREKRLRKELSSIRSRLREWGVPEEKINELQQKESPSPTITLTAPQEGTIQRIHKYEGEWVDRGERIYSLANLDRVWITLFPYESEVASLRIGQKAEVRVDAFPGETFKGRIGFINKFVHDPSRTIHTHIHTKNPAGKLKPGMYADARIEMRLAEDGRVVWPEGLAPLICKHHPHAETRTIQGENGEKEVCAVDGMELSHVSEFGYVKESDATPPLVIPETAPLLTGKRAVVYVLDPEASGLDSQSGETMYAYELREVELGPKTDRYYVVKDGLKEGEQVVYQGAFKIDSELQIRGEPSMMYPETESGSDGGSHQH